MADGLGLGLGLTLAPLAGLMAFLITYEEYRHHYPGDRRPALRAGLQAGGVTFLVFFLISVMVGIWAFKAAR